VDNGPKTNQSDPVPVPNPKFLNPYRGICR